MSWSLWRNVARMWISKLLIAHRWRCLSAWPTPYIVIIKQWTEITCFGSRDTQIFAAWCWSTSVQRSAVTSEFIRKRTALDHQHLAGAVLDIHLQKPTWMQLAGPPRRRQASRRRYRHDQLSATFLTVGSPHGDLCSSATLAWRTVLEELPCVVMEPKACHTGFEKFVGLGGHKRTPPRHPNEWLH